MPLTRDQMALLPTLFSTANGVPTHPPLLLPPVEIRIDDHCQTVVAPVELYLGKRVNQYHEERNGKKTVINLGYFDVAAHLKWVEQNPIKGVPKPLEHRKYVSHYYSGGDVCDVTSKFGLQCEW